MAGYYEGPEAADPGWCCVLRSWCCQDTDMRKGSIQETQVACLQLQELRFSYYQDLHCSTCTDNFVEKPRNISQMEWQIATSGCSQPLVMVTWFLDEGCHLQVVPLTQHRLLHSQPTPSPTALHLTPQSVSSSAGHPATPWADPTSILSSNVAVS